MNYFLHSEIKIASIILSINLLVITTLETEISKFTLSSVWRENDSEDETTFNKRPSVLPKNFGNFNADVMFPFSCVIVQTSFPSLRLIPVTYNNNNIFIFIQIM